MATSTLNVWPPATDAAGDNSNVWPTSLATAGSVAAAKNAWPVHSSGPVAPPGAPELWYSARSVDAASNATIADGAAIGTWKNLGSLGSAADAVQAVAGNKPTFRLVASTGKLNEQPSVSFDGGDWLQSAAFTNIPQPMMTAVVVRYNATGTALMDGSAAKRHVVYTNPFWSFYAGAGPSTSAVVCAINVYNQINTLFNDASSTFRANKVGAVILTPGTHGIDTVTIGANFDGSGAINGEIVDVIVWGTSPTTTDIEAYFDSVYGSTWPVV